MASGRTLRIPFAIDSSGGLTYVTSTADIVRQQIFDIIVTNRFERVMKPEYGANLLATLFQPKLDAVLALKAIEVKSLLQRMVVLATVIDVTLRSIEDGGAGVRIDIDFVIPPSTEVFTVNQTVSGIVTEETFQ